MANFNEYIERVEKTATPQVKEMLKIYTSYYEKELERIISAATSSTDNTEFRSK